MMLDNWGWSDWFTFGLCVILGLSWLLYTYAFWRIEQGSNDFDRRHDAFDEKD